MNVTDVMEHNVVPINPEATVVEAAKLMTQHDVSALPVVDAHSRLVGIISEADLIRREEIGTQADHPWWIETMIPAATLAGEFAKSHQACQRGHVSGGHHRD